MPELPPEELEPLPDPCFGDRPGPYAVSELRQVTGTRINPDAIGWYKRRTLLTAAHCPVKTCAHPALEDWLGDVRSFDPRTRAKQPPMEEWPLTAVMPQVIIRQNTGTPFEFEPMSYIVNFETFHSNPTTLPTDLRLKEHLPEGSRLFLAWFGARKFINGLWAQTDFWYQPWIDQFDGFLMPDFSAFSDDPAPQYLIGERMMQIFAEEGSAQGATTIPTIAWASEASLRRQIELWTSRYPDIHTIHLDCYGSNVNHTGWAWRWLFALEKYCQGKDHIRWLISGLSSGWTIRELNRIFPKRNYNIILPLSTFIAVSRAASGPEVVQQRFRAKIRQIQDWRSGREVADPVPRPDCWPKFSDVRQTRKKR